MTATVYLGKHDLDEVVDAMLKKKDARACGIGYPYDFKDSNYLYPIQVEIIKGEIYVYYATPARDLFCTASKCNILKDLVTGDVVVEKEEDDYVPQDSVRFRVYKELLEPDNGNKEEE